MIEIKVADGEQTYRVEGNTLELLAEIPIAIGPVMRRIFEGCPSGLKEDLIKTVFECILMEMQEVEA